MKTHPVRRVNKDKLVKPLSDEELGKFLKGLAVLYKDKRTGNRPLADALTLLADRLVSQPGPAKVLNPLEDEQPQLRLGSADSVVSPSVTMSAADVARMISDQSRTKLQLIELAAIRFSIPKSKLLRLTINDVREAIKSALIHEGSLAAISEAAALYGLRRQS